LRRSCVLKYVIEGKIEGRIESRWRRGKRRKDLLDGRKEKTGYWKLNEEAQDRTVWRTRFGRGHVSVVRHYGVNVESAYSQALIMLRWICKLLFMPFLLRFWNWYKIQVTLNHFYCPTDALNYIKLEDKINVV
jgi:hypothetical protein